MTRNAIRGTCAAAAVVAIAAILGFMTASTTASATRSVDATLNAPPASQIIALNSELWRLDTTSGALYKFRGDLENSGVRNTWQMRARPVQGATSGMLELQRISIINEQRQQFFLVDIVYGTTWILRDRGNTNSSWDLIEIFR
ncbi:MAG: hypothetical protein GY715_19785 [Planctomycetes bacterium]|nr:hypothetical protein [Planctomycetota bacterium]